MNLQLINLICQTLSLICFCTGIVIMYCNSMRALRQSHEARSILSALYFSEDLVKAADFYLDKEKDVQAIELIMKQHEAVRKKAEEIRMKDYSFFSGLRYKCEPVFDLKFPHVKDEV